MKKIYKRLNVILILVLCFESHTQAVFANPAGKIAKEGIERVVKSGADDAARIAARKAAYETAERSAAKQADNIAAHNAAKATKPVIQPIKQSVKPATPAPKVTQVSSPQQVKSVVPAPPKVVQPQKTVDIRSISPRKPVAANPDQLANIKRFEKKIPSNSKSNIDTHKLPNNGVAVQATSPAKNIPGSKAVYEKQIDQSGKTVQYTKTTYNPKGEIVHVKDKLKGQ